MMINYNNYEYATGLSWYDLCGHDRTRELCDMRSIVAAHMHSNGITAKTIGKHLHRSHATVLHMLDNYRSFYKCDENFKRKAERVFRRLHQTNNYAWVARERNGKCTIHLTQPTYAQEDGIEYWRSEEGPLLDAYLPETFYPDVTLDSEPKMIILTIDICLALLWARINNAGEDDCFDLPILFETVKMLNHIN